LNLFRPGAHLKTKAHAGVRTGRTLAHGGWTVLTDLKSARERPSQETQETGDPDDD